MRLKVDLKNDALYLRVDESAIVESEEVRAGVILLTVTNWFERLHDPEQHHRRSIRLRGWDYAGPGAYFVTIVTHGRELLFGQVMGGEMRLSPFGEIARVQWLASADIRREIRLDVFVVMPNHIHGVVWIIADGDTVGATGRSPLPP